MSRLDWDDEEDAAEEDVADDALKVLIAFALLLVALLCW